MPRLTINGEAVEVPAGTNLIEAARKVGVEVPHYCYHPALSIAGQCRLCMVDIEKTPRPTIACNTPASDGMVVWTETDRVKETRKSIMEFHLINHPLDCPVCDQAGECWLQIYYMRYGLYDPRMRDEKVHKPKAVPLGPHVMLDAERCILCSRCVRFCDEITGTGELGIFQRGDHSEIGLFPGHDLENKYSGNVVDICPVGALTDRDFRFHVGFHVPPSKPGDEDDFLIRADKNPNTRGAELIGLDGDVREVLAAARAGRIKALWIFGHDLYDSEWAAGEVSSALGALDTLIFTGTNASRTSAAAHLVLPAAAWVERDGTFTNFQGRVQRFRAALDPLGESLPEWDILGHALGKLGRATNATRAEHWFVDLAGSVDAFRGLTYQSLGDSGTELRDPGTGHPRLEPGSRGPLR